MRVLAQTITGSSEYCKLEGNHYVSDDIYPIREPKNVRNSPIVMATLACTYQVTVGDPLSYGNVDMAAMVNKNMWGVATALSQQIISLKEDGTIDDLYNDALPADNTCIPMDKDQVVLRFPDMLGVFIPLVVVSIATLIWKFHDARQHLCEILHHEKMVTQLLGELLPGTDVFTQEAEDQVLQKWCTSSNVRLAMYYPIYAYLQHHNKTAGTQWREAHATIFLDDEIHIALNERGDRTRKSLFQSPSRASLLRHTSQSNEEIIPKDLKQCYDFVENLADSVSKNYTTNPTDSLQYHYDHLQKYRPLGAEKAFIRAKEILMKTLRNIIEKGQTYEKVVEHYRQILLRDNYELMEARASISISMQSEPGAVQRLAHACFRERKLFLVPLQLSKFCRTYFCNSKTLQDIPTCADFVKKIGGYNTDESDTVVLNKHAVENIGSETNRSAVMELFDEYNNTRVRFGTVLRKQIEIIFNIQPYDKSTHASWVRYNSCLLEYILEGRAAAVDDWTRLENCIKEAFRNIGEVQYYAEYSKETPEVTRSDFAWALVVMEHYLKGLPHPVAGTAFRKAALQYAKCRSLPLVSRHEKNPF